MIIAAIIFWQIVGFSVGAPWYSELFSARLRYSDASLGFQIGVASPRIREAHRPTWARADLNGVECDHQNSFT
jgi:hypothetical protein